jgi:hypothetical protein
MTPTTHRPCGRAASDGIPGRGHRYHYDGYNTALQTIVEQARARRSIGASSICAVLDRLAYGGAYAQSTGPSTLSTPYVLPTLPNYETISLLTTDNTGHISSGGLIGLDGIHPTTAGYGLVAKEFIDVMVQAGVQFANG